MISTGYSNISPWRAPKDIPEEDLAKKIEAVASQVKNMEGCIFNFHCPPYNSMIDVAPELDEKLTPKLAAGGEVSSAPVGSTAVRNAVEKYQPLVGLHGHIHESKGLFQIGRSVCFNPGSEYTEGVLRGLVIELSERRIESHLFTSG
jgi:Icc-related predicted phosphoesterase